MTNTWIWHAKHSPEKILPSERAAHFMVCALIKKFCNDLCWKMILKYGPWMAAK